MSYLYNYTKQKKQTISTIRDKLEQVCREQQKLMKTIKNESTTRIREEEEKRKETQAHFQKSINEIFATLGKNNDENTKLKEANLEMTKKFVVHNLILRGTITLHLIYLLGSNISPNSTNCAKSNLARLTSKSSWRAN